MSESPAKKPPNRLYLYVLLGVVTGGLIGWLWPSVGASLKPIADGFIALIKMLIGPIIFCTVVLGIAGMSDMRKLGRVGGKAFLYFEVVSTLALVIGLVVANVLQPGAGFDAQTGSGDTKAVGAYAAKAAQMSIQDYILHIIPKTFFDAFTGGGDLLQVLLVAILFGAALARMGEKAQAVTTFIEGASKALFGVMNMVMVLAPLGAGAAMAYTIGKFGPESLQSLGYLIACFYLTCAVFILGVLGVIAWATGFNLLRFIRYIKDEILTVLGTSSSESALVPLMEKLERLGCSRSVVGIVVPAGYSFNLDGTNIYLTLAALFIAQALGIDLALKDQLAILVVALLTSKGASGVTGAGFITLAATLAVVPGVPVEGMALILGIDRFMSEARAVTNHIGNGVATIVVARWEGELDREQLAAELGAPQRS